MGWDAVADAIDSDTEATDIAAANVAAEPSVRQASSANVVPRVSAGRPRGSVLIRADIAAQEEQLQSCRAARQAEPDTDAVVGVQVEERASALLALTSDVNPIQKRLCLHVDQQLAKKSLPGMPNPVEQVMSTSSNVSSWAIKALEANKQYQYVQQDYFRTAEAMLQASGFLWSVTLQRLHDMAEQGFEPLAVLRKRRYDESPFNLRLKEEPVPTQSETSPPVLGQPAKTTPGKAKVMQSELGIVVLLRRRVDADKYEYQEVHGSCPTWLHVLDKTTKENIAESQRQIQSLIQIPQQLKERSKMLVDVVCTDRYAANISAERALQSEECEYIKSHHFCLLHKAAAIQSAQFKLTSGHISGILSLSLSMAPAGTTAELRKILCAILAQKLIVRHGDPPSHCVAHREALHELFLPLGAETQRSLLHQKQRMILSSLVNGDLQDEATITYWTANPEVTKDAILDSWVRHVSAALLPHKMPYFNRSKWLGGEDGISWAGLLSTHHGLLVPLVQTWAQSTGIPAVVAAAPRSRPAAEVPESSQGWAAVADVIGSRPIQDTSADSAFDAVDPDEDLGTAADDMPPESNPDISWHEFNKMNRRKALAWVMSSPAGVLVCMRVCMKASLHLLYTLVHLASVAFVQEQMKKSSQGKQRLHRVVEFFSGKLQTVFTKHVLDTLSSCLPGLPDDAHTDAIRSLAFRMLSVSLCAAQQLIWSLGAGSPFVLFRTLAGGVQELFDLPRCLRDQITHFFMSTFPEPADFQGELAQQMLQVLAQHFQLDILDLERNHSTIRRNILSKSMHTWVTSYACANAHWVVRRVALLRQPFRQPPKQPKKVGRPAKPRRSKQGGGSWRAWLHLKARTRGAPWTKRDMARIRREYHAAKAARTADFELAKNLGVLGQMAHRAGKRSFSQPEGRARRSRENKERAVEALARSAQASAEAIANCANGQELDKELQLQLSALASVSRTRTKHKNMEAEAIDAAVTAGSEALEPYHTESGLARADRISGQIGKAFVFTPGQPAVAQLLVPTDGFCQEKSFVEVA
ncbi:unnamed protein product [Symbiodinium sp. CCMP2592]|nr:unnamed protein product [Symbiodinium sp. CCMP2592]